MIKKRLNLNVKLLSVYFLVMVLVAILQIIISRFFPRVVDDEQLSLTFNSLMNLGAYFLLTLSLVLVAKRYLWQNQWVQFRSQLGIGMMLIAIGMMLMFTMNFLVAGLFGVFGVELNPENQQVLELIAQSSPLNRISLLIFAGFFAPIVEELVFRKSIYGMIERRLGVLSAIVFSSFLFGLIHVIIDLSNFIQIVPYMGLGLVLAFMYYFSGKLIFVPIFMHMIMNLISLFALLLLS